MAAMIRSVSVLAPLALCATLICVCSPVRAADASAASAAAPGMSKKELDAARQRVEKEYAEKVRECRQRFVVTSCLEDARDERIRLLRPLDRAEHQVNAEERQRRAAVARERIEEKERDAAAEEAKRKTESVKAAEQPVAPPKVPAAHTPRANPELHQRRQAQQEAAAEAEAAKRRQAAAERRKDIAERQRKAQDQQAKRVEKAASGATAVSPGGIKTPKPAPAHLPMPSASDIQALPKR